MHKIESQDKIEKLCVKYQMLLTENKLRRYNEEMTKKDFIRPLFDALGWNTEDSNEVLAEEKISKKRVDYSFRLNGIPKFFLEAKSLKLGNIQRSEFTEQAINYSWHKGCTWAVLTNFQTLIIINAEWKTANLLQAHFKTFTCDEYLTRFDELWLLSKDSFMTNELNKQAEKWGKQTRKTKVDDQLLKDFMKFREALSKNILKFNQKIQLTEEELDESVQRMLDRLIFIRYCEDRELEPISLLLSLREWESGGRTSLIKTLRNTFSHFDDIYNSKLFSAHVIDDLFIEKNVLRNVIHGLYFTDDNSSSYDFSAIDSDVLGNIYEQYLGHILRKTPKRATLTQSGIHKKEQGIYYTPIFVVAYIVRNVLDPLLHKKKNEIEKIKIIDPTCGSGSFLIKAFDVLNDYYLEHEKNYAQTRLDFETGLPFTNKVKILKENIFGVDLDKQAVEIVKLNLLLKIAEKGNRLPLLEQNIKCGNSLISDPKIAGNKAFNWEKEYKEILKDGGFDVIIGNPPYIHQKGEKDAPLISYDEREYYRDNYCTVFKKGGKTRGGIKINVFVPYVERCINILKNDGRMGFIVHKNMLKVESYKYLRKMILDTCNIEKIVDLGAGVFKEVTGETVILILKKEKDKKKRDANEISIVYDIENKADLLTNNNSKNKLKQKTFYDTLDNMFSIYLDTKFIKVKNRMKKKSIDLIEIVNIVSNGLNTSDNKKYLFDEKINEDYKKVVLGRDIERWIIKNDNRYVLYDSEIITRKGDVETFLAKEKLILQRIGSNIVCAYDDKQYYCYNSTNMITQKDTKYDIKYILGLLNSNLINNYYKIMFSTKSKLTVNVTQGYLSQLPIKIATKTKQKIIVNIVDKIIQIKKKLKKLHNKNTDEKTDLNNELVELVQELNDNVYLIYGINKKEKNIFEKYQ